MGERGARSTLAVLTVLALTLVAAACGSSSKAASTATTAAPATTAGSGTTTAPAPVASSTVWLCFPGRTPDPCSGNLNTTVVKADGTTTTRKATAATDPAIDCFYVYPTVSPEPGMNADLTIQPAETSVANAQASRFSQDCKVYAPMYRQLTISAIAPGSKATAADQALAYGDVQAAWLDYLAHDNHGRGVVLIGHSQGSFMLTALIKQQIDKNPAVRKRLVSAVLLGGNITVPVGKEVGGSFQNVPACTRSGQTGCVVAYSSFLDPPPSNSLFGRTKTPGDQVLCTNPAALSGGSAPLQPEFPTTDTGLLGSVAGVASAAGTAWVTYPGLYTGACQTANGATWLQVTPTPGDIRPLVTQQLGPTWGLHLVDVNIAYDDLTDVVHAQAAAYAHT
jgi:hypothetical protein